MWAWKPGNIAPRPPADVFREAEQPAAQFDRRAGGRLADVDFPFRVGAVGDIDADSRQPVSLLPRPATPLTQPQPAASHQEPLVAVDVESLL